MQISECRLKRTGRSFGILKFASKTKRSVNAKQLERSALQAEPRRCESVHGRQFQCSQGVISSARRPAKAEVHGANPCGSAIAFVPQQLQEEFCKLPFVGASPTEGSISFRIVV